MADMPVYKKSTMTRHEWVIGDGNGPITAGELRYGIISAQEDMKNLGIDVGYYDSYHVIADGYEIVLRMDVEDD